jgi:hypothetical protein
VSVLCQSISPNLFTVLVCETICFIYGVTWCYAQSTVWVDSLILKCVNSRRKWMVLCWNVCDLSVENRQREVRSKIVECECDIICLQETKCESFTSD